MLDLSYERAVKWRNKLPEDFKKEISEPERSDNEDSFLKFGRDIYNLAEDDEILNFVQSNKNVFFSMDSPRKIMLMAYISDIATLPNGIYSALENDDENFSKTFKEELTRISKPTISRLMMLMNMKHENSNDRILSNVVTSGYELENHVKEVMSPGSMGMNNSMGGSGQNENEE